MKGLNEKRSGSWTLPTQNRKELVGVASKVDRSNSKAMERPMDDASVESHPDPTRFGDWEQAGRCIDF